MKKGAALSVRYAPRRLRHARPGPTQLPRRRASGGEWTDSLVEGDLLPAGWGAALGYPELRPRVGGAAVAVRVLTAPSSAVAWPALDRFEGPEYECILVRPSNSHTLPSPSMSF